MFTINDQGVPVSDARMDRKVREAMSSRTISPRALAMTAMDISKIRVAHLIPPTFMESLARKINAVAEEIHRIISPQARQKPLPMHMGYTELHAIIMKLIGNVVKNDLQGFTGPTPISIYDEGPGRPVLLTLILPADGAVLRYISRAISSAQTLARPDLIKVRAEPLNKNPGKYGSIDGCSFIPSHLHTMQLTCELDFSSVSTSSNGMVTNLNFHRKVLEIRKIIESLHQAMVTLTRKVVSVDGSYGELPKFPIVNMRSKMSSVYLGASRRNSYHGNNASLFGDKSVYDVIPFGEKAPIIHSEGVKAKEYQWIQPKQ